MRAAGKGYGEGRRQRLWGGPQARAMGRAAGDGQVGWLASGGSGLKGWTPYKFCGPNPKTPYKFYGPGLSGRS